MTHTQMAHVLLGKSLAEARASLDTYQVRLAVALGYLHCLGPGRIWPTTTVTWAAPCVTHVLR